MSNRVYPDWVHKQKTKGTTVKKVGNNYYLYKHSSKRVPGKKNPVPVDTYIGKIPKKQSLPPRMSSSMNSVPHRGLPSLIL